MHPLVYAVITRLKQTVLSIDSPLLISFSGGPDSVFLLECLSHLPNPLILLYLDHQLRPIEERRNEQDCVLSLAKKYQVRCVIKKMPLTCYASTYSCSIETAGHSLRRKYRNHYAKLFKCDYIATGHHQDDQSETVFHQFIRGSRSLSGMAYCEKGLIKPLLFISKKDILEYLNTFKIAYSVDSTNADLLYTRNQLRHQVLPMIETLNPNYRETFSELALYGQEQALYFDSLLAPLKEKIVYTNTSIVLNKTFVLSMHSFIQKKLIHAMLELTADTSTDKQHTHKHVRAIASQLNKKKGSVSLPNGSRCLITESEIIITLPF